MTWPGTTLIASVNTNNAGRPIQLDYILRLMQIEQELDDHCSIGLDANCLRVQALRGGWKH